MTAASNVIPFRRPEAAAPEQASSPRPRRRRYTLGKGETWSGVETGSSKADREVIVAVMEEHLSALERAALIFGHALMRQRTLLEQLKAEEGWTWSIPAASALFGDAVLFSDCELQVVSRSTKKPLEG